MSDEHLELFERINFKQESVEAIQVAIQKLSKLFLDESRELNALKTEEQGAQLALLQHIMRVSFDLPMETLSTTYEHDPDRTVFQFYKKGY
jgi:hypothetical protein